MSKVTAKSEKPTQTRVFELLGRALYVCNVIELQLRWMHKRAGGIWTGKTPAELLQSIKKAVEKKRKKHTSKKVLKTQNSIHGFPLSLI